MSKILFNIFIISIISKFSDRVPPPMQIGVETEGIEFRSKLGPSSQALACGSVRVSGTCPPKYARGRRQPLKTLRCRSFGNGRALMFLGMFEGSARCITLHSRAGPNQESDVTMTKHPLASCQGNGTRAAQGQVPRACVTANARGLCAARVTKRRSLK